MYLSTWSTVLDPNPDTEDVYVQQLIHGYLRSVLCKKSAVSALGNVSNESNDHNREEWTAGKGGEGRGT